MTGLLVIANGVGSVRELGPDDVLAVRDAEVAVAVPDDGPPRLVKHRTAELRELTDDELEELKRSAHRVVEV